MDRVSVKHIMLRRAEGPITDCDRPVHVTDWSQANVVLQRWSRTAPANGGYDKCDFAIQFVDGSLYQGRYDLEHFTRRSPDLSSHVRDNLNYLAGIPPRWMTRQPDIMARFQRDLETCPQRQAEVARARQWLMDYDIGLAA